MTASDSSETSDADLAKGGEQTTAEGYVPVSSKRITPDTRSISSGRRLDVDAVLERSVRKVVPE